MTKILKESASIPAFDISHLPRSGSFYKRKSKFCVKFLLIVVLVLSSTYPFALAVEDYQDHAHRHHHHEQTRLHRLPRHNPGESDGDNGLPIINRCAKKLYPKSLKNVLEQVAVGDDVILQNIQRFYTQVKNANSTVDTTDENEDQDNDESIMDFMGSDSTNFNTSNKADWSPPRQLLSGMHQGMGGFRMLDKELDCPPGKRMVPLHWHILGNKVRWHFTTNNGASVTLSDLTLIAQDGKLIWNKPNAEWNVLERKDYCVWKHEGDWVTFNVCLPSCSKLYPCIRKCCLPWKVMDVEEKVCKNIPPEFEWRPKFGEDAETVDHDYSNTPLSFIYGVPNKCVEKYSVIENNINNFTLLHNGSLVHIDKGSRTTISPTDFCIDGVYNISKTVWDTFFIACEPQKTSGMTFDELRIKVYAALNFVSAIFLLLTDTVYILIWRHQNNIHSWLQFSYATSLLFTCTSFFIVQLWSDYLMTIEPLCKIMGWISHLFYLSAFFWLTSMNFDLWWRFSRPLRSTRVQTQDKKRKRFLWFAAFSIITPLLISSIGITLDYTYSGENQPDHLISPPGFGKDRCYFENKHSQIPYLYLPAGILLLVDFIFFASTVLHLRKMHTHTELARTQSTSTIEDKRGVRVIAKLFVVMGVLWTFELISWIVWPIFTKPEHRLILKIIFTPSDCLNSIQGVFIFFIFICKPNVRNQLSVLLRGDDDATKTWNKQTQLPSESTVQQPVVKQNGFIATK